LGILTPQAIPHNTPLDMKNKEQPSRDHVKKNGKKHQLQEVQKRKDFCFSLVFYVLVCNFELSICSINLLSNILVKL
jgi:hypothetical protein